MSGAEPNSLNARINQSLNGIGAAGEYLFSKCGTVVAPAVLGGIGGWLTGVGVPIGVFQGTASGIYHIAVHTPAREYIKRNEGKGAYDIHYKQARFFEAVGVIAGIAVPIFLTYCYGGKTACKLTAFLAEDGRIRYFLESRSARHYTVITGILVNIAPAIVQHVVSWWREQDERNKKHG